MSYTNSYFKAESLLKNLIFGGYPAQAEFVRQFGGDKIFLCRSHHGEVERQLDDLLYFALKKQETPRGSRATRLRAAAITGDFRQMAKILASKSRKAAGKNFLVQKQEDFKLDLSEFERPSRGYGPTSAEEMVTAVKEGDFSVSKRRKRGRLQLKMFGD